MLYKFKLLIVLCMVEEGVHPMERLLTGGLIITLFITGCAYFQAHFQEVPPTEQYGAIVVEDRYHYVSGVDGRPVYVGKKPCIPALAICVIDPCFSPIHAPFGTPDLHLRDGPLRVSPGKHTLNVGFRMPKGSFKLHAHSQLTIDISPGILYVIGGKTIYSGEVSEQTEASDRWMPMIIETRKIKGYWPSHSKPASFMIQPKEN